MLGHDHARNIHMGTTARHGRKNDIDRFSPSFLLGIFFIGLHLAHIIGVADADITGLAENFAHLCAVIARRFGHQIGLQAGEPVFEIGLPHMVEERRKQRNIIRVLTGADAYPPAPFGIGQIGKA